MTLDSFLNTAIPIVIVIIGIYLMYRPLREPLSGLGRSIKSMVLWIKGRITHEDEELEVVQGTGIIHYE